MARKILDVFVNCPKMKKQVNLDYCKNCIVYQGSTILGKVICEL